MKNLFKRMPGKLMAAVATVALVAGISAQALASFGPNRPIKDFANNGGGFDYVTFNSFTNVPNGVGDEREFFRGSIVGPNAAWTDPVNGVTNDKEVEMKILVHNNANPALNDSGEGIAKNVTVKAELPTGIAATQQAKATISADNAQPKSVFDTLDINGADGGFFEMDYIEGSAKMYSHDTAKWTNLSDNLVTTGVNIGDQKGCVEYIREITFRVKIKMTEYKTQKTARLKGEDSTKWRKTVNAKVGDQIEWRIWFANSGTTLLDDVTLVDKLPSHTTVVGNVEMDKGSAPTYVFGSNAIQDGGKTIHIMMGDFGPGGGAYVYYTTKINNADVFKCGVSQIINTAYPAPKGMGSLVDQASVNVIADKKCEEPEKPHYVCESLTVEKLGGRKVRVTVKAPASGGAKFKHISLDFGDGSQAKVTDKLVNDYEYAKDGTYKIAATAVFTVDGKDKSVSSDACTAKVTFSPTETPEVLPSTGAGSLIGLFTVVTLAAGAAHNVISRRANS